MSPESDHEEDVLGVGLTDGDSKDGANDVDDGEVNQEGHEATIFTIAFSPNGKFLLTGGQDGFCRLLHYYIEF